LFKLTEGRPNVLDMIKNGEVQLVINTPAGKSPRVDEVRIRTAAVAHKIPIMTTLVRRERRGLGIKAFREKGLSVQASLQEYTTATRGRPSSRFTRLAVWCARNSSSAASAASRCASTWDEQSSTAS
jgi:hypothetical protein